MRRQQFVKVIITMMTFMCSTLSWGQEQDDQSNLWFNRYELVFYSDSIHVVDGIDRNRIYSDTLVYLSPNKHHYVQITDKPVYLLVGDTQTGNVQQLYAYDYYPNGQYENGYGTWIPSKSPLCSSIGSKEGWTYQYKSTEYDWTRHEWIYRTGYYVSTSSEPVEFHRWTFEDFYQNNYNSFKMEPGLYYVEPFFDDSEGFQSFVITMAKLCDLYSISSSAYPRISRDTQKKNGSVNVSQIYDNIYVTGKDWYEWVTYATYIFEDERKITGGEYNGYLCQCIGNISTTDKYFIYPPASKYSSGSYIINGNPKPGVWNNLTYNSGSSQAVSFLSSDWDYNAKAYAIWDLNGNRIKFITEETYKKEVADYVGPTAISTPNIKIYDPDTYFNLQGIPVETPTPGQIYIHNGKKVVYKK